MLKLKYYLSGLYLFGPLLLVLAKFIFYLLNQSYHENTRLGDSLTQNFIFVID